ncbi:MAG: hypothetical protein QNJ81_01850 [Acidimicrobiia bacterium]|nr:hypothetical protein [Acidimicrobiia bacterium]
MIRSLIVLILAVSLSACAGGPPELRHDDTVPDDLRALADETWGDFVGVLPGRHDCVVGPTLSAAWELETRAEYSPRTTTLTVRVPGTPATLRSQLLHEFAHHLEFTCPEHTELRSDFLAAQGFADGSDWFAGPTWEETPSEHYAEAVVELVEGRRTHSGGIRITDEALAVVRDWGKGP